MADESLRISTIWMMSFKKDCGMIFSVHLVSRTQYEAVSQLLRRRREVTERKGG